MKRNILSITLVGMLVLSGIGAIVAASNQPHISESIKIEKPLIKETGDYLNIDFEKSTSFLSEEGKPMLPFFTKTYILPFGSKIKDIKVSFSGRKEINVDSYVKPSSGLQPLNSIKKTDDNPSLDSSIYESSELYPKKEFTYRLGAGLNGKEHVTYLSIYCYPVRYNPSENIIFYSENINIDLNYEKPKNPASFGDDYDLIIVTPEIFSSTLQGFVNHKNSVDISTMIKTTEEIFSEYEGRDKPEKIKYFIKDAIETYGAKYALFIGDMDLMPIRLTDINIYNQEGLPTDLYYADIYDENGTFCTWDTNNNGKFGEYEWREGDIDFIDGYADINVGRIPCKNKFELKTAINKIITYETKTYNSDWFDRAVLMGGDTFPGRSIYEGEVVTEAVSNELSSFNNIKLWTSTETFKPRNINKEISKGAGFVSYSGHGYETGFGTSPPNEEDRIEYFTPYTLGMQNGKKYPIFFFDACSTARLDYTLYNIKVPSFAWYLIIKPFGGAVATIGATRVAFTMVDNEGIHGGAGFMNVHFFKAYEPGITVSEMLVSAQNDYLNEREWKDCITLEEFILLGDPTLKVGGYPSLNSNIENSDETVETFSTALFDDSKPDKPDGVSSGSAGVEYTFSTNAPSDPSLDEVYYLFDWDDGTYSEVLGSYNSGDEVEASHTWSKSGVYNVRIKALLVDYNEYSYKETEWSEPLSVTMPKDKSKDDLFLTKILDRFFERNPMILHLLENFLNFKYNK